MKSMSKHYENPSLEPEPFWKIVIGFGVIAATFIITMILVSELSTFDHFG